MRTLHRLTATQVARLRKPGVFSDGGGLYLQITPRLTKSWLFRFMRQGKARGMGLGPLHTVSLAEAREKALNCRRLLVNDIDPLEERRRQRAAAHRGPRSMSFRECASRCIRTHRAAWKNARHLAQWENTLSTYAYPVLGEQAVGDIETGDVLRVLEPIWLQKTETASRLRGRMEAVLAWAAARGYRSELNPARWKGHMDQLLAKPSHIRKVRHLPAMFYADVPGFMRALEVDPEPSALALRLLILTATRTSEVVGARHSEFDLDARLWTIPAARMKASRMHRVPLSDAAIALLRPVLRAESAGLVFQRRRGQPLPSTAMLEVLKRHGHDGLTVHGFRSTFKDWARETTDHAREISEAALAHAIGDSTEAAYARGDLFAKRAALMQDWADHVAGGTLRTTQHAANDATATACDEACPAQK